MATGFFFNMAHDEEALEKTMAAAGESLQVTDAGLRAGDLEERLEAPAEREPFRRLVR